MKGWQFFGLISHIYLVGSIVVISDASRIGLLILSAASMVFTIIFAIKELKQ